MAHITLKKHGATWFASVVDPDDRIIRWSDSTLDALNVPRSRAYSIAYIYNRAVTKNGGGKFAKIISPSATKETTR